MLTATVFGHVRSESLSSWAFGKNVWTVDWSSDDHAFSSSSAIASGLGASIIACHPPFASGSPVAVAVGTDLALPLFNASVTLEDLAFWAEAALLVVSDQTEHVEEVVP